MTPEQEKQFFRESQFTLKGRIFHPALLVPKENKEKTHTNYHTMFAWKAEENVEVMAKLNEFLGKAYNTFYSTIPVQFFTNPVKKFETYMRQDGKPNPEYLRGHYWVNAATGLQVPPVVCKQGFGGALVTLKPEDEAETYSGRNAVMQMSFYRIKKNKQGLSTNVNAVMLLEGGEKQGGFADVDVNSVFSGFKQDMGQASSFSSHLTSSATQAGQTQTTPPAWPPTNAPANNGGGFV